MMVVRWTVAIPGCYRSSRMFYKYYSSIHHFFIMVFYIYSPTFNPELGTTNFVLCI